MVRVHPSVDYGNNCCPGCVEVLLRIAEPYDLNSGLEYVTLTNGLAEVRQLAGFIQGLWNGTSTLNNLGHLVNFRVSQIRH